MNHDFSPTRSHLGEQVSTYLRDKIYAVEIEPGTRLNVVEIASQLGVSRSPVRDALLMLVAEGLVEQDAGSSRYQVIQFNEKLVHDVFIVRKALEPVALRQAIDGFDPDYLRNQIQFWASLKDQDFMTSEFRHTFITADNELHRTIAITSHNKLLQEMLSKVVRLGVAIRFWQHKDIIKREEVSGTISEHIEILEALLNHENEKAVDALATHIDCALQRILSRFETGNR